MTKRILAYILFVLGFLTVAFFRNYNGTIIPYEFVFALIGILCFWAGWALLRWTPTIKEQNNKEEIKKMINELKANGEKIKVELSKCEIKSNDYSEEQERYKGGLVAPGYVNDIQALNILSGDEMGNVKTVDIYQSVLIFKHNHMGRTETYISNIIPTEHTTLLFKLDIQKTAFIYIDKQDRTKYYFDLEFLFV